MAILSFFHKLIQSIINWLYKPFNKILPVETFRYAVTGGFNTLLDIFLYFITYNFVLEKKIVHIASISISAHIAAFLLVFPVTFISGFTLAKYITFNNSQIKGREQLIRYGITVLVCIFLNYVFIKVLVEYLGLYPTPSKIIATIFIVIYSYVSQKYFTFKTKG